MSARALGATVLLVVWAVTVDAGPLRMVVADLPYARVWQAAVHAVRGYPVERAADGSIVTGWRERPGGPDEVRFERVRERVTLRVEPYGTGVTRVTVELARQGWQAGDWVSLPETTGLARAILAEIRERQG